MQEPVYVLHLFTCHGRIMPRLAELLFHFKYLFKITCRHIVFFYFFFFSATTLKTNQKKPKNNL